MANEQRTSRASSNSKEDSDLAYDIISGGDAPVDRHDVVLPGQGGRASDDQGIEPAGEQRNDEPDSRSGPAGDETQGDRGTGSDGASAPARSSGGVSGGEAAPARTSSGRNDDNEENGPAAPLAGDGDAPRDPLIIEPAAIETSGPGASSSEPAIAPATTNGGTVSVDVTPEPETVNTAPTDISAAGLGVDENASGGTVVATLSATDSDAGETFTYTLINDPSGFFQVAGDQIIVAPGASIDYETLTSHDVTIQVTDSAGNTYSEVFTINVNDLGEFGVGPVSDADASSNAINESASVGTVVGITALATDPDGTDTVTYSLTNDAGGLFTIDANTGVVTVAGALDAESAQSHNIEVTATSSDGSTSAQSFTIGVNDVDEFNISATSDSDGSANSVSESAAIGTAVGVTALATDADVTDSVTYSLSSNPGGFFAIDANTGVITVANALDYESTTDHTVQVTSTSSDGSTSTQTFTIDVSDADEFDVGAISDTDGSANAVNENVAIGATVGITANASDADGSDTVSYSLSNVAGGLFAIDANTGVVTVAGSIDRETAASYNIEVTATSTDGSTSTQSYTIKVNDIDEFDVTTPVDSDSAANTVAENASIGTSVGVTALASDADATNNSVTYSLSDDAGGLFTIDANTGVVTVAGALDYESAASHAITVQATSADGSTATETFTVNVSDANEGAVGPVSDADASSNAINESASVGTVVGITALASDPDGTDTVTYSLSSNPGGLFAIDANTGVVTVAGALDAESAQSHNIEVTATSSDGSTSAQSFTIGVNDVDEFNISATSDSDGSANTVSESATVGTAVGVTALATDADVTDTVTYSLSSNPGGFFAIDANTGVITVANALDYETSTDHTVQVTSTSSDGSTSTQTFTIDVSDADEFDVGAISDTDGSANAVNENVAIGSTVGITASASDADGSDTVTYSLSNDAGGLFAIDANTGVVTVAGAIDRETAASYNIEVTATSTDGSTSTQSYTINVNDIDEFDVTTPVDSDGAANTVAENASIGTSVGVTALASDADATNNSVTYSLSDDAGGLFTIDANTGVVTVAGALDYESAASHAITVQATSADGSTATETFTVNVSDANEGAVGPVSDADASSNAINESASVGTVVGITALATDPDGTDTVTYSLTNDAGGLFTIDANTGVVTVVGALDAESAQSHNIEVTATSSDGSTSVQTFTIGVNDVDEFNISATSDSDGSANTVSESATVGTAVGVTALATDADVTDTVTYSLSSNPGGFFAIDANTGVITVANALDYETSTDHTVQVTSTSSDGSTSTQTFTIDVSDADEFDVGALVDTDGSANAVNENVAIGSTVGITASASDADGSDTVTYSLSNDAGGLFAIDATTGVVTVAGTIDREAAASYNIEVTATSTDGSTSTQSYTIAVNDIDEFDVTTPVDTNASANSVAENAANGTVVGITASASDADATNNTVTYSLVDGSGNPVVGGAFVIDANTGVVTIADNTQLDYETATTQTIIVQATSADGSTASETFTVNVTDAIDEAPTDMTFTGNAALASSGGTIAAGTVVADVTSVIDADAGDTFTYTLTDNAGGMYQIDANTGAISLVNNYNISSANSDTVTVQVTDSGGNSYSETIGINLGTDGADTFNGTADTDIMYGLGGNDTLSGGGGDDILYGGDEASGSAISFTQRTGGSNPFDGINVGKDSSPALVDIDGDGDLDLFVGNGGSYSGDFEYFENTGTASNPVYSSSPSTNPFGLSGVGDETTPAFADIDGDGDLDMFAGYEDGTIRYFENTGDTNNPTFAAATTNPFGFTDVGKDADITFADIDGDGDLDAFVGNGGSYGGNIEYFQNTGTASNPVFAAAVTNPFGLTDAGSESSPTFADVDGDGDLDMIIGNGGGYTGNFQYFENTGTSSNPIFASPAQNPWGLTDIGKEATPTFADIDGDGDLDMIVGEHDGNINYFENTTITSGGDTLNGGDGNDTLIGGGGADILDGGAGTDTADYSTSASAVTVDLSTGTGTGGDAQGDTLANIENVTGSNFNDTLTGDAGANTLSGGLGNDTLNGGDGSDTFIFQLGGGTDTINGGSGGGWTDMILLQDASGGNNLGTYGVDWTVTLSEGTIDGQDANGLDLSDDADGIITLSDGSTVNFFDIERIDF